MPANKKYLLKTRWGRTSKILAAIPGAIMATAIIEIVMGLLWNTEMVVVSMWFSYPLIWVTFICAVYWIKKPWKAWVLLLSISLVGVIMIYFIKYS